ncbi:hypothetical protein Nepgr_010426 [Nepenthes gracilis]|uniref:Uncharacterized protein n=1 Tax=Nepenthes gracilis TaxID=150966 RepID=A0AAD3SD55_NEPGR|nr:hypothetical protein Nepgr_010426 [Nepenthes gracilis]
MACSSRGAVRPSRPHSPPPIPGSSHPALPSKSPTSPTFHPYPPLQKVPHSSSPGPDAVFLASLKSDCISSVPGDGFLVRSKEAAPPEIPGSEPGSAKVESELTENSCSQPVRDDHRAFSDQFKEAWTAEVAVGEGFIDGSVQGSLDGCPIINYAQSHVASDAIEIGFDPLSLAILMLTEDEAFRRSLNALALEHKYLVLLFLDKCWCNLFD